MTPAPFPWWGWLVAAGVLWLLQLIISDGKRNIRLVITIGIAICALIGIIQLVKGI